MSTSITNSFAKQFEREVHIEFQNKGGYMRPTVRTKTVANANSTTMQVIGSGEAVQKARHGEVPAMNVDHTPVEIIMQDWYAKEYVDKLDELKIMHDERGALVSATVYALGRRADRIIMDAMNLTSNTDPNTANAAGINYARALEILEKFGDTSVPDDGQRYCVVGWNQWSDLLGIGEFNDADKVGAGNLPIPRGTQARMWLGMIWFPVENLPKVGVERSCFAYHKSTIGLGIGSEVRTDVWWNGEKVAHSLTSWLSMGSTIIEDTGVMKFVCDE